MGFQEGLEAEIKLKTILETVEQGELIDKDGASGKAASMSQSLGGDLTMTIEDTLEVLVEMLDG